MAYIIKIYSTEKEQICNFLKAFSKNNDFSCSDNLWKKEFENPLDMIDIMSCFVDNKEKIKANMWISLDRNMYILVSNKNINLLIKYFYERFPY